MLNQVYESLLRKRAVTNFIKDNSRAPNQAELTDAVAEMKAQYPTVESIGVSGTDLSRPQFLEVSSTATEYKNRQALYDDAVAINDRLRHLETLLEDSFRGFYSTVARMDSSLRALEGRVDKMLLLNSNVDVFAYGIEETFDTNEYVSWLSTDASVENGYVSISKKGYERIDLSDKPISCTAVASSGILNYSSTSSHNALKEDDGEIYELMVYTRDQLARVTALIDIDLGTGEYVQQVELTGLPIEGNKQAYATVAYSLDGTTYAVLEPAERPFRPETVFDLGLDNVKKIQIRVAKDAADAMSANEKDYLTLFSFDSVKLYSNTYSDSKQGTLIAGPYDFTDSEGNAVYYTKASLSCCTVEPEGTSISWFLGQGASATTVDWYPINPAGENLTVFSAGSSSASQSLGYVSSSADSRSLQESVPVLRNLDFNNEAVINTYIDSAWITRVPTRTILVKRNVPNSAVTSLLDTEPGWSFDPVTRRYHTTVYVSESNGRYVDFGSTGLYVSGQYLTGNIFFSQGYTEVSTDDNNWLSIESGLNSETELDNADPRYPYNHKYLIGGYDYPDAFRGARVYNGFTEHFGNLLSYLPLEEFSRLSPDDIRYYKSFTLETGTNGNLYLKVKVNKADPTWSSELIDTDWTAQGGPVNTIWVKAILSSSSVTNTPIIEDFNIRVI